MIEEEAASKKAGIVKAMLSETYRFEFSVEDTGDARNRKASVLSPLFVGKEGMDASRETVETGAFVKRRCQI